MSRDIDSEEFWYSIETLLESSELKYKSSDYKGSIEDKRKAKILVETANIIDSTSKFEAIIKNFYINSSKYDLIEDYKRRIDNKRRLEIIEKLKRISDSKYISGDYKGAIKALRRSEKYY